MQDLTRDQERGEGMSRELAGLVGICGSEQLFVGSGVLDGGPAVGRLGGQKDGRG
jgi:hypothetical protein